MDQVSGTNLLMLKIEKGDLNEIIQCIQKYPKYINLKNKSGNSAITTAIRLNDLSILKILLDNKADVNIQTKSSQTPLYLATFNNQIEVVSILLQYNANVNISDQRGWSPLMIAANKGFIDIIYLLLNSLKCDLFQKNQRGETVFELAKNKEVLNIIVDNCGFKVSEIEDQLGNSIMCGIRTKLNCNNNSLQNAQKTLFDAGSFYQKEVKRVQSTFKSICEKNHSQLNKLRNDLASIQGEVIQKKSYQKGKLLQENKEILNQQDNNYSSKYQNQSVNSYQSNQANNNIPYVTQFNYDSQNYYSQNSNQAKIEIQNESLIFSKANSNNITPSKGKQLSINSNSKSQIKKYSGGEDQSTQIISSNSQNRNNLPPSSQTQKNAVSHYGSNQSNNFNINSSQKKSSNKISSFIVTDDIPDSSSTKSNKKNFGNSNGGRLEQSMDEYSQSNNDQQITETSKFKELEEDFLKKSSSELIEQFIRQLMSQIKFLIPNIPTESYTKYESSITYFIEQLINNPNLSHIEKILVLMQFQSQILIEIMQNQQKNHQQKTIPQTTNSSFQNINQISNTQSSDEQKYLTTSGDATEDNIKKVDFNINLKQIPQISTVQQKKQQVLLDMINQESSPSLNENSNNYQINVKQPQQQQAIKEKYYQMAKNKHFQMDGIIEQPTLEMIETPSQNQSQSKKMQFPNKDSYQQYIHENEVSKRTEDSASKNEEPSIPTISPPRNISEDEDILSTLKDSSKSDFCQSQTKQSNQNFKLNFSDKQNRKQLIQQDKNSAMFQILGNQKSEQNQYLLQQDNHDYQISEKFSITDNFLNFNDNAISSADIFHHAEYNTIESFNTNPNLLTSDQNKETKSFIDDTRHGFVVEYKISNEKQNQFDEDDMILDQNLQRDEYDEIADQLSQTNLNKNLFDQVHVFNGNKCQVVQSGQTSKAQSEIDYEISPTNSSRVNQGVQQIFSQRNNQKNENQNQEGYLYNIQQFDYNQYDYTSDEDSNEHQNIQYISQAQNSERQSKNKLHTSNDTILNQGKKQEQASKKTHSDNQNQFENDQINEQTDNQTLNSNFCGEDLKQNDQNNIASHSKQQGILFFSSINYKLLFFNFLVNMHQRNIQKLQKMNEALNEKLNQIQQNRVNLQLKMKNKI
ncbi:ankyrin domain protein (macronuclear) [Tetrahymena thermophila SB210]|uniref:Ankyrin domain protein n=1 Tax=Tetrahymena thermophila (strain SB210) TaxID=312017 RepID=I7MGC3_TETTS|nr:ankyrin domain protein [Tetrahymena thermophila SB210]EAR85022.2 ankyrin domain protein [Tetrahymena thermophila SB210]|eukprot:XP_001032685.2 ankyrin domain protein [Tetrahymena thermophila SB210]